MGPVSWHEVRNERKDDNDDANFEDSETKSSTSLVSMQSCVMGLVPSHKA